MGKVLSMVGLKKVLEWLRVLVKGFLLLLLFGFAQDQNQTVDGGADKSKEVAWSLQLPNLGSLSSPRATDLNGDGVLDIVIGAGRLEFQTTDTAIVAINGKSGDILWKRAAKDQIFGSASLLDINQDGVEDIVIGGRSATLQAIEGRSGALLWDFV